MPFLRYFDLLLPKPYSLIFAQIPSDAGAINLLYAATSEEVKEKDISGRYMTPYGFINSAPKGKPASDPILAEQLWKRSIELCEKYVPEMKIDDDLRGDDINILHTS
jgi:hypothetical protein